MSLVIPTPADFNFEFALQFLKRSAKEILHQVDDRQVSKAIRCGDELVLFLLRHDKDQFTVDFPAGAPSTGAREEVKRFIVEWFDLECDLRPFYRMASKDELLGALVKKYKGYRIMSHPDLFESLVWAVLGQQINLQFAYTLKQRFVETFGSRMYHDGKTFHLFPDPLTVSGLGDQDLSPLQFSRQKSQYAVNLAKAFVSGQVSKELLRGKPLLEAKEELMKIKGVGNWTANYALMRTYRHPDAFPLEDAGLHNAIRNQLGLKAKPSVDRVRKIFKKYKGFEAYATLYLWKSL